MAEAPTEGTRKRPSTRVRDTCRKCGRLIAHHSSKGIYSRCKHCGAYNPGPAMMADLAAPPDPGKARRLQRKEKRAGPERAAPAPGGAPDERSAPAPVRRKPRTQRAQAPAGAHNPSSPGATPGPATTPPPPPKRGLVDRILFGGEP